jgi:uncharacterized protein (TIGR04255 family)
MDRERLKNPPLVEAIFELRWELQNQNGIKIDPHYKIMVGRMYDLVKEDYPIHEPLPSASMPDEISAYVVQHRFREGVNKWPLIQIGPGIATLNATENYTWSDFEKRILKLMNALFKAREYPDSEEIRISEVLLRYIDARDFDYDAVDIFKFLREKMKIDIRIQEDLFSSERVTNSPLNYELRLAFPSSRPQGTMHLRLGRAVREQRDALVWQTMVQSIADDAPKSIEEVEVWASQSHELTHDWFFKLIKEIEDEFE